MIPLSYEHGVALVLCTRYIRYACISVTMRVSIVSLDLLADYSQSFNASSALFNDELPWPTARRPQSCVDWTFSLDREPELD